MRAFRNGLRFTALISIAAGLGACSDGYGLFGVPPPASPSSAPGDTLALTTNSRIVSFNKASPSLLSSQAITGLQAGETLLGIDIRPSDGMVYGLGSTGRVYTINVGTGAATMKSMLAADPADVATATDPAFTTLTGTEFGIDFNPVVDRMRVVSDTGTNLRIDVDKGLVITDRGLNTGNVSRAGITDAAYTNSFGVACRTTLFFLDTTNNRLVVTNDPNNGVLTDVGNLGITAGTVNGFEVTTGSNGTNTAVAALTVGNSQSIYTVNLTNGTVTANGAVVGLNTGEFIRGLAIAPPATAPTQAVGNTLGLTESSKLISFNNTSPQKLCTSTAVGGLSAGETILGIDVRPANGSLYGVTSTGRLVTINTSTAAITAVANLAADTVNDTSNPFTTLTGTEFGVDFNPTVDRLRIVSDMGQNIRVNPDTGLVITDTNLNPAGVAVTAAAYTNSFLGALTTTLYVVDTASDQLMIQGNTAAGPNAGDVAAVGGALGLDTGAFASFEINALNNTALLAVSLPGATTSDLDTLNLTTGAATRVNTIGGGERVRSIAFNINPVATVVALTGDNQLVTFKATTPGTFDTTFPVSGLQGGENLIGIDYRPANGKLYGATDGGRLYTLDPTSGGATFVANLAADPNAMGTPFTALDTSATFGFDFNPMADRLRIVSGAGANLRVNVDTGFVTMDTALTTVGTVAAGAAYTANFAGSPLTSLFDIDSSTGTLFLQNPPNAGALTAIGLLGVTFTAVGGFDIAGGDNGLTIAALQATAGGQSSLYRINLSTGLAAPVVTANPAIGPIGPAGTVIRAMTVRLM